MHSAIFQRYIREQSTKAPRAVVPVLYSHNLNPAPRHEVQTLNLQQLAADDYQPATSLAEAQDIDWLAEAQHVAQLYQPPRTGRPSNALTDVYRLHELLKRVHGGTCGEVAAIAAGFARQTYYNWKHDAKDGQPAAIRLMDAIEKAEALSECEDVEHIRDAGKDPRFWAAKMTRLERRHPSRWARQTEGESGPKVVVQIGVRDSDVQVRLVSSPEQPAIGPSPLTFASDAPE